MVTPRTTVPVVLEAEELRRVHRALSQHAAPLSRVSRFLHLAALFALEALERLPADSDLWPDLIGFDELAREVRP